MEKTINSFLENSSKKNPEKTAVIFELEKISYSHLNDESDKIRNYFCSKCKKGERIGILLDNSIEFIIAYFGILKAGCIAVLFPTNISDDNLLFEIKDCQPSFLIYEDKLDEKMKRINAQKHTILLKKSAKNYISEENKTREVFSEDACSIIYTSGTTSKSKGVLLQHKNVVRATENIKEFIKNDSSDIFISGLPLSHSFGLGNLHSSIFAGGKFILERNFINLKRVLDNMLENNATILAATPATLNMLVNEHKDYFRKKAIKLKGIITNTGPISKELVNSILDDLNKTNLYYYYGLTEASRSSFINFRREKEGIGSVGKASPNTKIEVRNGEICINGKHVISQYWNDEEASKKIKDGWLYTGDSGYFDDKGYIHITGRVDDIINVNGEKVYPEEIEGIIKSLGIAQDVAAVGAKDNLFGEVVHLYVVSPNKSIEEIIKSLNGKIESYKMPKKIIIVKDLPKTDSGKIKRSMLRK
ncbi:MAG: class I adenylate-forming enzyme family protein [Nanoarchaeota archaeon]